jgi:phosphoglucomutase
MKIDSRAGQMAIASDLVNVPKLIAAYYEDHPDPHASEQRVAFGTSGHRGSSFHRSFNEDHILAVTQAICLYRQQRKIDGPLFLGIDTHALSWPAFASALEVLAANRVDVMLAEQDEYTPTPVISHAILTYNRRRKTGLSDGIVITPSHNPPESGGFKYNPPHGGPAEAEITSWIEGKANELLTNRLNGIQRMTFEKALSSSTTHKHDYRTAYVNDLQNVVDMEVIRNSGIALGVDPLGGAGVHYWQPIAERYGLNLKVVNGVVDPTFRFMTLDWDGRIRMDPSSPYAMQSLVAMKDGFDIAFACDTDHDRHGIVTKSAGLLPPNHYLSVCIYYLFANRPQWGKDAAVGKTVVSSSMIDRVAAKLGRKLYEVPVGFKYFVDGLLHGALGFAGEESAGASFLRRDGIVWKEMGDSLYDRAEAPANDQQRTALAKIDKESIQVSHLAGEKILTILTHAPGDGKAIGGVKVVAESGWFAARPSGTEEIYKIYAESFRGKEHLQQIEAEAQSIVGKALSTVTSVS